MPPRSLSEGDCGDTFRSGGLALALQPVDNDVREHQRSEETIRPEADRRSSISKASDSHHLN